MCVNYKRNEQKTLSALAKTRFDLFVVRREAHKPRRAGLVGQQEARGAPDEGRCPHGRARGLVLETCFFFFLVDCCKREGVEREREEQGQEEEEVEKKKKKKNGRRVIRVSSFLSFSSSFSLSPIKCPTGAEMTVVPAIVPRSLTLKLDTVPCEEREGERGVSKKGELMEEIKGAKSSSSSFTSYPSPRTPGPC